MNLHSKISSLRRWFCLSHRSWLVCNDNACRFTICEYIFI